MSIGCGGSSLFGPSSQYIKVNAGDFVAVNGSNASEKMSLSDLRMPFKQILKSRIILKPGQANYLLNHLGMGDNATFLLIKASYDSKSVIQDDNYVDWSFYDSLGTINQFAQVMLLTGNTTHRVKQIYLTNPNTKYAVSLDVMVAVIDENYSFFNDNINQTATSFTDLEYSDIHSHIPGESIVINDKSTPVRPLIYFMINNINSIERDGKILTVDDNALSTILLAFKTETDAIQAHSLLTYIIENPDIDIDLTSLDNQDPVITFYNGVGRITAEPGVPVYNPIRLDGYAFWSVHSIYEDSLITGFSTATRGIQVHNGGVPGQITTIPTLGLTFSASISLATFGGTYSTLDKSDLIRLLIYGVTDNRDGQMSLLPSNVILKNSTLTEVVGITGSGTYSMTFNYSDIAQNYLDGVVVNLNIIA
jgi:hypothetical protein